MESGLFFYHELVVAFIQVNAGFVIVTNRSVKLGPPVDIFVCVLLKIVSNTFSHEMVLYFN